MADSDDIKPTQPIFPARRLDRREQTRTPPKKDEEASGESEEQRRPADGHKGQNIDDYA